MFTFHLSQSIIREVQEQGLQQQLHTDEVFRNNIRMIAALAFESMADILQSFDNLPRHCVGNEHVILDYFETNYIREFPRGGRRDPRFPHNLWNIHRRVVLVVLRTNNMLEGWHKSFNASISIAHPTIWKFISILRHDAGRDSTSTRCMIYRWKCT